MRNLTINEDTVDLVRENVFCRKSKYSLTRGVKFKRVNFTLEKEWFCTFFSHPSFGVNLTMSRVN